MKNTEPVPQLLMKPCDCGKPGCDLMLIALLDAQQIKDALTGKQCPCLYAPENVQSMIVDAIFELWRERNPAYLARFLAAIAKGRDAAIASRDGCSVFFLDDGQAKTEVV